MRAPEGSLDAPEDTKADASRKMFNWKIPEDARAGGKSNTHRRRKLAMQGSVETRSASEAQPEKGSLNES